MEKSHACMLDSVARNLKNLRVKCVNCICLRGIGLPSTQKISRIGTRKLAWGKNFGAKLVGLCLNAGKANANGKDKHKKFK